MDESVQKSQKVEAWIFSLRHGIAVSAVPYILDQHRFVPYILAARSPDCSLG